MAEIAKDLKKTDNLPAAASRPLASVPMTPPIESEILQADIIVPQLLLMQGLSDLVNEGRAQQGQIVRSTPFEIMGGAQPGQKDIVPVEFIPLRAANKWMYQELVPGKGGKVKAEFRGFTSRDGGLEDNGREEIAKTGSSLPWDFKYKGADWKRVKVFDVFALLPKDILAYGKEVEESQRTQIPMDPDKMLMPVVISFRNTSFKAGQEIATYMYKAEAMRTVPFGGIFNLGCEQQSNDDGTFYVYKVSRVQGDAGKTNKRATDWLGLAQAWTATLRNQRVRVDEPGLQDGVPTQF